MDRLGPYRTTSRHTLEYVGNRQYEPIANVDLAPTLEELTRRCDVLASEAGWGHLAHVNARIFQTVSQFFHDLDALFVPLPLTTRMISSPGAVYGRYKLNYTTDTVPVTLNWFDVERDAFLSESSQIYLELALLQHNVDHVFSIYNSFRKEHADATHLSEFHHIEYEGHVSAERNVEIAEQCIRAIIRDLLNHAEEALHYFLVPKQLQSLQEAAHASKLFHHTSFQLCLAALYEDTHDERYREFSLQSFGSWEEVRLTEIFEMPVAISGFPLYEVPFYHAIVPGSNPPRARNTDLIWSGYREIVGAGQRIAAVPELEAKAEAFQLPPTDYAPYLQSRRQPTFQQSSGFGLGWERIVQGLLCLPTIWLACPFPRTHLDVVP